jgi:hypothetical protein
MVDYYIAISEEAIPFVWEWLGLTRTPMGPVYFIHVEDRGSGGYASGTLTNFQRHTEPPWALVHEVAHAVLSAANINTTFPMTRVTMGTGFTFTISHFEEGLCVMLELLYEIETQDERYAREAAQRRTGAQNINRMTQDDALRYVNSRSLLFMEWFHGDREGDNRQYHADWGVLQSDHSAASFLLYLYTERGTREEMLRAYRAVHLMEEIYGTDMNGMIADWLDWLGAWR